MSDKGIGHIFERFLLARAKLQLHNPHEYRQTIGLG